MKKLLVLGFFVIPFFAFSQTPKLTVSGENAVHVRMSQMKVAVNVIGDIAYTTTEMHFYNDSNKQMEAELVFPLPEGVSVSRYAIDINGKIREAVPVNKNKGKQVFEAIEHRRVDPGLLEKVAGNNFRTRIYPIMPKQERIVIIGYQEKLARFDAANLRYAIKTDYATKLDLFELSIAVVDANAKPSITSDNEPISLEQFQKSYTTKIEKNNFQPHNLLQILIPVAADVPAVSVQSVADQHYFYATLNLETSKLATTSRQSIGIIYDVSLSCKKRNFEKEMALLDAYFKKNQQLDVTLYFSGFHFDKKGIYAIRNGNWDALKAKLAEAIYDGGSRFSKIELENHDAFLWFTDGLSSLSSNTIEITNKPIFTISSMETSDFAFLNHCAFKTNGNFINLNQLKPEKALDKLVFQQLKFLGIKENYTVAELYPIKGTPVAPNFSIAGISLKAQNEITLLFGYENTAFLEKKIQIDAKNQVRSEINIEKLWVQKKLTALEMDYKANAETIELLGKKYGIITPNTSLIVLETLADYVQYEIVPPAEMRAEYDAFMKQNQQKMEAKQKNNWENIASYHKEIMEWWLTNKKYSEPKKVKLPKQKQPVTGNLQPNPQGVNKRISGVVSDELGPIAGANVVIKETQSGVSTDFDGNYSIDAKRGDVLVFSYIGTETTEIMVGEGPTYNVNLKTMIQSLDQVVVTAYSIRRNETVLLRESIEVSDKDGEDDFEDAKIEVQSVVGSASTVTNRTVTTSSNTQSIRTLEGQVAGLKIDEGFVTDSIVNVALSAAAASVKTKKWNPDRVYLKVLEQAPKDKKYAVYLQLREEQENNPSFYFDVAHHFYENGAKKEALVILSAIADLSLENHQLYKSLTYVFRQWEAYDEALFTAKQVAIWRPFEPQSHRDLALALEDTKKYQAAFDTLLSALETNYFSSMSGQYEGVEAIIVMDLKRLLENHNTIETSKLNKEYLKKMPVDLRIVLNWNQMDTDIDLHIIEPTGEECYYAHTQTKIGATFSKDFTDGYGPEQYLVRNAYPGTYQIKTNYYGETKLTENGPATVLIEIYQRKANGKITRTLKTIQLGKVKENQILAEIRIE